MSLRKRPTMNGKSIAASRANGRLSRGPLAAEQHERIRTAHLRLGFDPPAEEAALRAFGEDPAHYQELVEELWEEYNPVGASQEGLVIRLARATWLMNRADRMQEGYALRQAKDLNTGREDRVHAQMMRLKITAESLRLLGRSVARKYYVTLPADFRMMKNMHEQGAVKEMGEIALALFYRLEGHLEQDETGLPLDPMERARLMVEQAKEIFGIGRSVNFALGSNPAPGSTPQEKGPPEAGTAEAEEPPAPAPFSRAEWDAREQPRHLLEHILKRQVEICQAQHKLMLKESLAGPSPYERAAEIAPTHPSALHLRRMQDSHFREVRRVTNLLIRIQRQASGGKEKSSPPWNVDDKSAA